MIEPTNTDGTRVGDTYKCPHCEYLNNRDAAVAANQEVLHLVCKKCKLNSKVHR